MTTETYVLLVLLCVFSCGSRHQRSLIVGLLKYIITNFRLQSSPTLSRPIRSQYSTRTWLALQSVAVFLHFHSKAILASQEVIETSRNVCFEATTTYGARLYR